jgi:bifunctional DNA-binding transcriptional regulator/antitoxin component of YhaV-PrlF toxin-antitoxin module
MWVWEMDVGETVNIDERGRVMIPAEIRRIVKNKSFKVETLDKDTIILRAVIERGEVTKKIQALGLSGDRERCRVDAAEVKDYIGGMKDEGS